MHSSYMSNVLKLLPCCVLPYVFGIFNSYKIIVWALKSYGTVLSFISSVDYSPEKTMLF